MNQRQSLVGFDFQQYNKSYLTLAKTTTTGDNDAQPYDVRIVPTEAPTGQRYWRVIGVRHLTPEENTGKHNLYADLLDEEGNRIHDPTIRLERGWEGQHPNEAAPPVAFDKGDNEPATNIPIEENQHLWVRIDSPLPSDKVENLHTKHADERGPHGEIWNSVGHHSFYVVFQRALATATSPVSTNGTTPKPPVETIPVEGALHDNAAYLEGGDAIPALTVMQPGQPFVQTWRLRNNGSNAWADGYHLVCVGGSPLGAPTSTPLPPCAPGNDVGATISCVAPNEPGPFCSVWRGV